MRRALYSGRVGFARAIEPLAISKYDRIFHYIAMNLAVRAETGAATGGDEALTNAQKKILVVDDEPDILEVVAMMLEDAGYEVLTQGTGEGAVEKALDEKVDLVVLDLGLPGIDGLTVTRSLKERGSVGVIIISGRGEATEKIIGLEIGADDYLGKPFEPRELLARVRSVLRRMAPPQQVSAGANATYRFEGWSLDTLARALSDPSGEPVSLSSGEFSLLQAFAEHPNRVLSRDQLLDFTHGMDTPAFDRSVDVQIARLRKKIEPDAQRPTFIKTVRNAGYIFSVKVEQA